ncbi:MAG: 30S ribosome-binding factor RbfA [Eubacterium sp.]
MQQKMKDNRFKRETISITRVKATSDLKTATVFVSIFGTPEEKQEILGLLDNAKGFLRSNLGKVLKVHSIPALTFKLDDSIEYGMHIDSILASLKKDKGDTENEEDTSEDS